MTRYRAYRGGAATPEMDLRRRNPKGAGGLRPHTASLVVEGTARSVVAQGIDSSSFLV